MGKYNTTVIEETAVGALEKECRKYSEYLHPSIPKGDKGISWDGFIEMYRNDGESKEYSKKNFEARINIQVKGHEVETIDNDVDEISYVIETVHLLNYQKEGNGTILFVVYVDKDLQTKIFFANFLPADLKMILEDSAKKTKTVKLKSLSNINTLLTVCRNFAMLSKLLVGQPICNMDEFIEKYPIKFTVCAKDIVQAEKYITTNDVYPYALINDYGSKISFGKVKIFEIGRQIHHEVHIDETKYYDSFKCVVINGEEIIKMGKGITWNLDKNTININLSGTITERIIDSDFFINIYKKGSIKIGKENFGLKCGAPDIEQFIEEMEKKRENFKLLKKCLEKLGVKKDISLDGISKQDCSNLNMLIDMVNEGIMPNIDSTGLYNVNIGNEKILIWFNVDESGKVSWFNYFENIDNLPHAYLEYQEDRTKLRTSPYMCIKTYEDLNCLNINIDIIKKSFDLIENPVEQSDRITLFLLEVIKLFDKLKEIRFLNLAEFIIEFLENNVDDIPEINLINKMQIIKRTRKLKNTEKKQIRDLMNELIDNLESEEDFLTIEKVACLAILLNNKKIYHTYFSKLSSENKEEFNKFPINVLRK